MLSTKLACFIGGMLIATVTLVCLGAAPPQQDTTEQRAHTPAEAEARLGEAIRNARIASGNLETASVKLNQIMDRMNHMLDRMESGGLIIRMQLAPLEPAKQQRK